MKRILILAFLAGFGLITYAQGEYEALLFSQTEYMGTARYMGVCGAFSSAGADFSALNSNPAALGLYKRAEFSFTPAVISLLSTKANHYGNSSLTFNPKYTASHASYVGVKSLESGSGWRMWQLGVGFNRIMDFNSISRIDGSGSTSIVCPILEQANGIPFTLLTGDAQLAWKTYMIDTLPGSSSQYGSCFKGREISQDGLIYTEGGIDEMDFTVGGNYNDRLFLGLSVGVPVLHYETKTELTERPVNAQSQDISECKTVTSQENDGTGVNLKLGIFYQRLRFMRLGISFHTPTYYWNIGDSYCRKMQTAFVSDTAVPVKSDVVSYSNRYNFALITPLKANVSAAFIIAKRAFIDVEYELADYGMSRLFSNDYGFESENQAVDDKYKPCHTVRLGTEVTLLPHFMLRAGYAFKSSPYKASQGAYDGSAHFTSVGFGYRGNSFFFDMAYVYKYTHDLQWLYDPDFIDPTEMTRSAHRIVATAGYKF